MKIEIVRNVRLTYGEIEYSSEEEYESDYVSFTLVSDFVDLDKHSVIGLLTIGGSTSGKQIDIFKNDIVHINESKK